MWSPRKIIQFLLLTLQERLIKTKTINTLTNQLLTCIYQGIVWLCLQECHYPILWIRAIDFYTILPRGITFSLQKTLLTKNQEHVWSVKTGHGDFHFLPTIQQDSWFTRSLNNPKTLVSLRVLILIFSLVDLRNYFSLSTYIFMRRADPFTSIILTDLRHLNLILL